MPIHAFIAYDFALARQGSFANVLEDAKDSGKPDLLIRYPGDSDSPTEHGSLWDKVVGGPIDKADRFLAYIDLPNANVGFEIGYAFGKGKPVGIYRFSNNDHEWLKHPPLVGHIRHHANQAERILEAIRDHKLMQLASAPSSGDQVMVLCPVKGPASSFRKQIDPNWKWTEPPLREWTIDRLPEQFRNVGCVVWIILKPDEPEENRDGTENTVLSFIAGFAHAHSEMELHVLIHENARFVADLGHVSKKFSTNVELKKELTTIHNNWQAELAKRKAAVLPPPAAPLPASPVATLPSSKPSSFPKHPHDTFPAHAAQFIGRESQLGTGADAVEGIIERFGSRSASANTRAIQMIWAHGFGGMGKSWCLHRIRCLGQKAHPQIRSLIIDWDKPEWLAPLQGEPRIAEHVFDLLATRLCQRITPEAAEAYWDAKDRVRAAANQHKATAARFENQIQLALTGTGSTSDSHLIQLLRAEGLWDDDTTKRDRHIRTLQANPLRHRDLFMAWCAETGEHDPAVICPRREMANGLHTAFQQAMQQHPLIVVLDTCEVLSDELHAWLREVFVPLIRESAPLLLLIGSRLKPDLLQPRGSRRGWLSEAPRAAQRIEDFGEVLRFQVDEIEAALGNLKRPAPGNHARLAEVLHHVTLGVPLALRGLLDLHEDGVDVLSELKDTSTEPESLNQSKAIQQVITDLTDRWLLNLEDHPEREDDLRDITALALLPVADHGVLNSHWHPSEPIERLRSLAHRYSLLSDGDLHPTVRACLRRRWRDKSLRHSHFNEVLSSLASHTQGFHDITGPMDRLQRIHQLSAQLNLDSWRDPVAVIPQLARALCLARIYEADCQTLETLLHELALLPGADKAHHALWHDIENKRPSDAQLIPWLHAQRKLAKHWTEEQDAALALLEGIQFDDWTAPAPEACAAFAKLELAVKCFGLDSLPRREAAGEGFFNVAYALDPLSPHKPAPDHVTVAAAAYERAAALGSNVTSSYNNLANFFGEYLQPAEKGEFYYRKAIELDPNFASAHNGLGNLYQHRLQPPEQAEAHYRKAIDLGPKIAQPHHGLGELYQHHLQQPEQAETHYRKAIELDPKSASPHSALGLLNEGAGRWAEAVEEYQQEIALDAKSSSGQRGMAWVALLRTGDVAEARRWAEESLRISPKHAGTGLALMGADAWEGDWTAVAHRFLDWVRDLPEANKMLPWVSRRRLAALLRKAQEAGELEALAVPLRTHAGRNCWEPWAQAVDALLLGSPAPSTLEGRAAECFRLLQPPQQPEKETKPRKRKGK